MKKLLYALLLYVLVWTKQVFHPREKKLFKNPLCWGCWNEGGGAPSKSWWNSTTGWRVNANLVDLSYIINASNMHNIAWYCMALYGIVWYCMVFYSIAWYCWPQLYNQRLHHLKPSFIQYVVAEKLKWSSYMKIMCLNKKTNCKEKERHQDPKLRWFQIEFTTPQWHGVIVKEWGSREVVLLL